MSIQSEITRIQNAKQAIKTAINSRGGNITNELLSQYASVIDNLSPTGRVAYIKNDNGTLKVQPLSFDGTIPSDDGNPETFDIKIFDTGVAEPEYGGGGTADVTLGVVDATGKFQAFSFDGTTPSDSGNPETVSEYKSWNSTLPSPTPSGGSTDFYKCASVDTTNHIWTGYKAVLNQSGSYEFEASATTGLEYDPQKITPVIDMCYTDGALLIIDPYVRDILVDENTMFFLHGSLRDQSGHVDDSNIVNHGIVVENELLTFPNNGYATITGDSLPNTVLCDDHDWTVEAKINIISANNNHSIFGQSSDFSCDLTVHSTYVQFNIWGGLVRITTSVTTGEHIVKLTHTSSNEFMVYLDNVAGAVISGSGTVSNRNYRNYDLNIGWSSGSYYFSPNTIDWLRISDCIR